MVCIVVMAQIYNYQESFWDEEDQGVNVLLQHVGRGIHSCEVLLEAFVKRSELEMDYARRLGALSAKIQSGLEVYSDYNSMSECLKYFQTSQQSVSNSHSMACERLRREDVGTMKDFVKQYRARWSTIKGNVENLRRLKEDKRKGLKEVEQELVVAETKLRDCQLNKDTVLGQHQRKENARELEKWSLIADESQKRRAVLTHEYKAARHHWFEEWGRISGELQDLETQRIQVSRELLQQYADFTTQPSELEISLMEQLKQRLSSFTPELEISHFSYHHGTGRIKLRNSSSSHSASGNSVQENGFTATLRKKSVNLTQNDRYVQNVKRLSTQLKNTRLASVNTLHTQKELPKPRGIETVARPVAASASAIATTAVLESGPMHKLQVIGAEGMPLSEHQATSSQSSHETSSNSTDFTHAKNKPSYDSMSTSLSSMASSVDDSQRFAKSWNSHNRKKSRPSSMYSATADVDDKSNNKKTAGTASISRRRKSLACDVEGALEILEKDHMRPNADRTASDASSNLTVNRTALQFNNSTHVTRCKRINDDGVQLSLPIVDSAGNPVIKYAKATYAFTEQNENNILNFEMNDILLLVEYINDDWYVGEVYQSEGQHGLVPMNYVKIIQ